MKRRTVICGIAALTVAACVEPVEHSTASGKPEVLIDTQDTSAVKSEIVSYMINSGYSVTTNDEFTIAFDRPVDNAFAAVLLGSSYDSTPNARITYTIIEVNNGTRVIADSAIITNPGSAFERRTPMNNSQDSKRIQELLTQIQLRFV